MTDSGAISSMTDMKELLAHQQLSLDELTGGDGSTIWADEHLQLFRDQIETKTKELASNASMILEELELFSSSPTSFADLDSVALLGDFSQLDDSNQGSYFNFSMIGAPGESWLQDIDNEVSLIEKWDVEAEKLALIATAAFENLKTNTSKIMERAKFEAMSVLETKADEIHNDILSRQREKRESHKAAADALLDEEAWRVKEVVPLEMDVAFETIKSLNISTYKLRDEKHRDLGVAEDVRRTRHHVGIIDKGENDTIVDPATIFSYNVGAISKLASYLEQLLSKAKASTSFFHHESLLSEKIATLRVQTKDHGHDFKSPSQLGIVLDASSSFNTSASSGSHLHFCTYHNSI